VHILSNIKETFMLYNHFYDIHIYKCYKGQLLGVSHGDIIYVWEIPDLNMEKSVNINTNNKNEIEKNKNENDNNDDDNDNNNSNNEIIKNVNSNCNVIAPKLTYCIDLLDYNFNNKFIIKSVLWHSISLPTLVVFSISNCPIKIVLPRRYVYVYACIYMYAYIYIYIYMYTHIYICTHIYIYIYMYVYSISLPTLIVFSISNCPIKIVLPRRYVYMYVYVNIYIYKYVYGCNYLYICISVVHLYLH
jgi:hypothetical protein